MVTQRKKSRLLKIGLSTFLGLSLFSNSYHAYYDSKFSEKSKSNLSKTVLNDDTIVRAIIQVDSSDKESLKQALTKILGNFEIKQDFDYLLSGFSIDIPRKVMFEIAQLKQVKNIKEAKTYYPTMSDAVSLTQISEVWQSQQFKGEGMVVAIIDTGIDVTHKDMRLDDPSKAKIQTPQKGVETQFTLKVPYGYNYADGNDNVKDNDKVGKTMHGMHVAGIVGANATDADVAAKKGIDGVAPEAQLLAMKVFTNNAERESAYEDAIVKAIEDSVKLGADVINMSLGTDNGFEDGFSPEQIAIKKAKDAGVVVVISAGNAAISTTEDENTRIATNTLGLNDNAALGEPSTSPYAISVASMNNATETGYFGIVGTEKFLFKVATNKTGWDTSKIYDVVDVNYGDVTDFNNPDGTPMDLTDKIAFIRRGNEIMFADKYKNAINHHAAGIIMANNIEGEFGMANVQDFTIPGVTVSKAVGDLIQSKILLNEKIQIHFEDKSYVGSSEASSFSSWGPTLDLAFKPKIMAPGGNIYSTINNDQYKFDSGTSMAAPHISGAIALMKGALKDVDLSMPFDQYVKLTLMNTAKPIMDIAASNGLEVSPRRQGAGVAQINNAIKNRVLITDDNNESAKALKEVSGVTKFNLNLKNIGNSTQTYTVRFSKVLTQTLDKEVKATVYENATIKANKSTVTLNPKGSESLEVTLDLTNTTQDQFVEGYIYFDSTTDGPSLVFPYMGFNGDWGKETPFDKIKDIDENFDFKYDGVYNTLGLVSGNSYLGSTFNMFTFGETVDHDKVAFSPNGDGTYDSFTTVLGLLRNIKQLDVDVVEQESADAEPIVHLTTTYNVRKPLFKSKDFVNFFNGNWDGKVFNQTSGKYEVVKDGQYYVRLKATMPSNHTKYHYTYLPVKLDSTKPELEMGRQYEDGNEVVFEFKASDTLAGLADEGVGVVFDDEHKEVATELGNDLFEYRVAKSKLYDGKPHTLIFGALDSVYNVKTHVVTIGDDSVQFYNFVDLVGSKSKYFKDGSYNYVGRVGNSVATLEINGVNIELDNYSFDTNIKLNEGSNELKVVTKDANRNVLKTEIFQVSLDTTPPVVNVTNLDVNALQHIVDGQLNVVGNVSDESGKPVSLTLGYTKANVEANGDFNVTTKVDWTRIATLRATDAAGNEMALRIRTVFESSDAFKIYFGSSLSTINYYNAESP